MNCEKCGKEYKDIFDTIIRIDYAEPGKGKPYEYHVCITCRKNIVSFIENKNI